MTRILLVDDHSVVRHQLRRIIHQRDGFEVCGEAADGQEGVDKHAALKPHLTVLDFNMPRLNGLQAAVHILKEHPSACILMLSVFETRGVIEEAKRAGIRGFCSKNSIDRFFDAVEAILRGETYFPN